MFCVCGIGGAALYRFRRPEPLRRQIQRRKRLCKPPTGSVLNVKFHNHKIKLHFPI